MNKLKSIMFSDRREAGQMLSQELLEYRNSNSLVLALPRGGVVVGAEVAHKLDLPLDIIVTRKIGHPNNPEYAICAVDQDGMLLCNEVERIHVSEAWLKEEAEKEKHEANRRVLKYRGTKKFPNLEGKVIVLIDDGIATGLTMRLAVMSVKAKRPSKVIVAVPVAPDESVKALEQEVDEVITLVPPRNFLGAVGSHYLEFEQVEDEEVIKLLENK